MGWVGLGLEITAFFVGWVEILIEIDIETNED